MDQGFADDRHQDGGGNGFRNAGGGDGAHDEAEDGFKGHILGLGVLVCQQNIDAAHDEDRMAQCGDERRDGQGDVVLLCDFFYDLPQDACHVSEEDPAAQGDPQALGGAQKAFSGHEGGECEGQKAGGGGVCPDGAKTEAIGNGLYIFVDKSFLPL